MLLNIKLQNYQNSIPMKKEKEELTELERIEKVMREPLPIESTDQEERIRRNLLIGTSIAFVLICLNLELSEQSEFLGLKFTNLNQSTLYYPLLAFITYEWLNYGWIVLNKFGYWRVRLTGITTQEYRGSSGFFGDDNPPTDHFGSKENSNFYTWMLERQPSFKQQLESIQMQLSQVSDWVDKYGNTEPNKKDAGIISERLNNVANAINRSTQTIDGIRVSGSMLRFDDWYDCMVRSQSWRWLIVDAIFPLISGFISIALILYKLFSDSTVQDLVTGVFYCPI